MSRQRFIYPEIFTSQQFIALSHSARLLWIGLFTCADDHGRGRASPAALAATVFPTENQPPRVMDKWLGEVAAQGLVELYEVAGARYYAIPTWNTYQHPRHVGISRIPPPNAGNPPARCPPDAGEEFGRTRAKCRRDDGSGEERSDEETNERWI